MNRNEPYISNRSLEELRSVLEARNDPHISRFLELVDEQLDDLTITKPKLDAALDGINASLDKLKGKGDAFDEFARSGFKPEPRDWYVLSDDLDEVRWEINNSVECLIGLITGEGECSDALYVRKAELQKAVEPSTDKG